MSTYLNVLRTRHIRSQLTAVFLSAVPLGMLNLTILLCVLDWTGSRPVAGLLGGVFSFGNAAGLALQGRIIDRSGPRPVILIAGPLCAAGLAGFVVCGGFRGPVWLLGLCVAMAGISVPAITAAVRAWLPKALEEGHERNSSYALLSVLFQAAVTSGPLLVSLAMIISGPELAVWVAATLILLAATVFAVGRPSHHDPSHHDPSHHDLAHHDLAHHGPAGRQSRLIRGSERMPGLTTILAINATLGLAAGVTAFAIPAVTSDAGVATLAGALFAATALGDVCGAIVFGSRQWASSRAFQLRRALLLGGLVAVFAVIVAGRPLALLPIMFLGGLIGAPTSILLSAVLDSVVASRAIARSYALMVSIGLLTAGIGNIIAGLMADVSGPRGLLAIPVLLLVAATTWSWHRRQTL